MNLPDMQKLVDQVIRHFERLKTQQKVGPADPMWEHSFWHLMDQQLDRLRKALASFEPTVVNQKITPQVKAKILEAEPGKLSALARDLGISRQMIHRVRKNEGPILVTKTKLPFGWLSNMSAHPISYEGVSYKTAEHLFQRLRFDDSLLHELIEKANGPMQAKNLARANKEMMTVKPASDQDVLNMEMVLRLKLDQHPKFKDKVIRTGSRTIIEDVTKRPSGRAKFWGAAFRDGQWIGENTLGKLWMKLREELLANPS